MQKRPQQTSITRVHPTVSCYTKGIDTLRILCFCTLTCLVVPAIHGCATQQNLLVEKDEVVALVKSVVLEGHQMLSDEDTAFIMQSSPETGQYKMAGTFGQYFWHWSLPSGRSIDVSYTGDLKALDKNKITIRFSGVSKCPMEN